MPRQALVTGFEEGSAGATVPTVPPSLPLPVNVSLGGGGSAIYTSESHAGSLAMQISDALDADRFTLISEDRRVVGGSGWIKYKVAGDNKLLGSIRFLSNLTPGTGPNVSLFRSGSNLNIVDHNSVVVGSIAFPADQWINLQLDHDGAWRVSNAGGTLASGAIVPPSDENKAGYTFTAYANQGAGDVTLVDDITIWIETEGPVVRLYPRDDGRGMSSAPRIWPQPKGRSRIIGGYQ